MPDFGLTPYEILIVLAVTVVGGVIRGFAGFGSALAMADELGVEMPITQATHQVLFEGLSPQEAIVQLMQRPPRSEW